MDDDAELLASLIDEDHSDEDHDAQCTAAQLSGGVGTQPPDSSQANQAMEAMMAKMKEMQDQISSLQSQLQTQPSNPEAVAQQRSKPAPQKTAAAPQKTAASPSLSDVVFKKGQKRTARTGPPPSTQTSSPTPPASGSRPAARATQGFSSPAGNSPAVPAAARSKPKPAESGNGVKDLYSGLQIVNPLVSSSTMSQRMEGRRMFRISRLISEQPSESQLGDSWVTIGVLIKKTVKQSKTGSSFSIWNLSDLSSSSSNVNFFLFDKAHSEHWKASECSVVGLLAPTLMDNNSNFNSNKSSYKVYEAGKVMMLGMSRDAGYCKSITKGGNKCNNVVNRSQCEYCEYHVQAEYKKVSAKRMECQGVSQKPQSKSIMERIIGKNNTVSYGGRSYGVPSRTAQDLQGIKTSGPMAKRSLHQMAVPSAAGELKEVDTHRRAAPCTVTRATGQVTQSSAGGVSDTFKKLMEADSAGSRLLRGVQTGGEGSGNSGTGVRTARDLLVDEDKAHGYVRQGVGRLPSGRGGARAQSSSAAAAGLRQATPSARGELGGRSMSSSSMPMNATRTNGHPLSSLSTAKPKKDTPASQSFSNALSQSASTGKRKSTSQSGSDRKRSSTNGHFSTTSASEVPMGGEAFADDQMSLDQAFDEDKSLETYVKTPIVKEGDILKASSSVTPTLGRGFNDDDGGVISFGSAVSDTIMKKRQDDAKARALLAVSKSGGLAYDNPNAAYIRKKAGKSISSNGTTTRTKENVNPAKASPGAAAAAATSSKSRLSSLVQISEADTKRVSEAQSSHYDEAKLVELEHQERYFNKLERKEDMENKMKEVMEINVKVVQCKECSYTAESAARRCSKEHKEKLVWSQTVKRFFECEGCKQRESSYARAWPTTVCKCGLSNYRRVSMFKERSYKPAEFEWNSSSLLIRGPEQNKYVNN